MKFCRVVEFGIDTAAPAIGLSAPKTTKPCYMSYHVLTSCWTNPKKWWKKNTTRTRTCPYSSKLIT